MKIGIVDNYDSFTYNLVHYVEDITGTPPLVMLNDQVNMQELDTCTHIILSPGPGLPAESGALMEVVERMFRKKNILGVCLGQQALGQFFGGTLKNLQEVMHGVKTGIHILPAGKRGLYHALPDMLYVGRYHSWVVDKEGFPEVLEVTAVDENGEIMSFQHKELPIQAVQYHPESIMTDHGMEILRNWIRNPF